MVGEDVKESIMMMMMMMCLLRNWLQQLQHKHYVKPVNHPCCDRGYNFSIADLQVLFCVLLHIRSVSV